MQAIFDVAALAVVAYAKVDGHSGASTVTNSGHVKTAKRPGGGYFVSLDPNYTQDPSRDLVLVQATNTKIPVPGIPEPFGVPIVVDAQEATKIVIFGNETTIMDQSFTIVIFRTTITPPVGAPA